jgi:hypothetical protein
MYDVHGLPTDGHAAVDGAVTGDGAIGHPPIPALMAVGVVVTKAALIEALRLWLPQLQDVEPLDADRFFLRTAPDGPQRWGGR